MKRRSMVTRTTSERHRVLLDTALNRASSGTQRYEFLQRLGRSLDEYGSLTPAMIEACRMTISPSS